jgi:hypothetical protein
MSNNSQESSSLAVSATVPSNPSISNSSVEQLKASLLREELNKFKSLYAHVTAKNDHSASPEEQLSIAELTIDLELKSQLIAEGESRLIQSKQEISRAITGRDYVAAQIKKECWDSQEVKGKTLKAFKSETAGEVSNFPLRLQAPGELLKQRKVLHLRRMELIERRWHIAMNLRIDVDEEKNKNFIAKKYTEQASYIEYGNIDDFYSNQANLNPNLSTASLNNPNSFPSDVINSVAPVNPTTSNATKSTTVSVTSPVSSSAANNLSSPEPTGISNLSFSGGHRGSVSGPSGTGAGISIPHGELNFDSLPRFPLFHPLDCISSIRKRVQTIIISMKIEAIKRVFNENFNEFYAQKIREIEHIQEKAKRIEEIQNELQIEAEIYKPQLSREEIPESVLIVTEEEIKAKKFDRITGSSTGNRAVADSGHNSDGNIAERALQAMMNGTLQSKRNLSLLESEFLSEEWAKLPPEQLSEEQKLELQRFEKKIKLIQLEQETRKKLLHTELSKLKGDVADIARTYDNRLKILIETRIATQKEIFYHERSAIDLVNSAVQEEIILQTLENIRQTLVNQQNSKNSIKEKLNTLSEAVGELNSSYERAISEVKGSEKAMKKELADFPDYYEILFKLFKQRRNQSNPASASSKMKPSSRNRYNSNRRSSIFAASPRLASIFASINEENQANQGNFGHSRAPNSSGHHRKTSSAALHHRTASRQANSVENGEKSGETGESSEENYELSAAEMPEGINAEFWAAFCAKRRAAIAKELSAHRIHSKLVELTTEFNQLEENYMNLDRRIMEKRAEAGEIEENYSVFHLNSTINIRTAQGIVELEESPVVSDLSAANLIHRKVLEQINSNIVSVGGDCVAILRETAAERANLHYLQWNLSKFEMELLIQQDINRELQLLRVTKELQNVITNNSALSEQNDNAVKLLNSKFQFKLQAQNEKNLSARQSYNKIKAKINKTSRENAKLMENISNLERNVAERVQITQIRQENVAEHSGVSMNNPDSRMKGIVTRRKLVDLAKLQSQEIEFLRNQVDLLRKKTFAQFPQQLSTNFKVVEENKSQQQGSSVHFPRIPSATQR